MYENHDLTSIVTPVNPIELERLLTETQYDPKKSKILVEGFTNGFPIGYEGPRDNIQRYSPNLKFEIGDNIDLWNKVMKEVKMKRYAGPYDEVPFDNFIQSPIGLVPKDHGKDSRLIFHLSYPRDGDSINSCTPKDLCKVKYPDFNEAVDLCMNEMHLFEDETNNSVCDGKPTIYTAKSDLKSAFRVLPLLIIDICLLIMMAVNPLTGKKSFFVDKCLPFGASISCAHFQSFSDGLAHIQKVKSGKKTVNYLDDFFFATYLRSLCNRQVEIFLDLCNTIGFPVSLEKTVWATTKIVFLGLLINGKRYYVGLPLEKIMKVSELISNALKGKKLLVHQLQRICGFLNFLGKAIVPGRVFTRRLYSKTSGMKQHHHIRISKEMRMDLEMWDKFLKHQSIFCRPFIDFQEGYNAVKLNFYTDASKNPFLGCGGICGTSWFSQQWISQEITDFDPSIEYLELYAVTVGILLWLERFKNMRIILFCDNKSACDMINSNVSRCRNCMVLLRLIVLESMLHNTRVFAVHVKGKNNRISDSLSRLQMNVFWRETRRRKLKNIEKIGTCMPNQIWPISKIWMFDS